MEKIIIGTYTQKSSKGIMQLQMSQEEKTFYSQLLYEVKKPSYLIRKNSHLVSVFQDEKGSGLLIFKENINSITLLETIYSGEKSASTHLAYHPTLDIIASVNYGEGSIQIYKKDESWKCEKRIMNGEGSHPHFAYFTKDGKHLIVCDLGHDSLITYDIEGNLLFTYDFEVGDGPRHLVTNKDETLFFVLCELSNQLKVLKRKDNKFNLLQSASTLRDPESKGNNAGAIRMTNDEQFIYTSTRNVEEAINVFKVDDHRIERVQNIDAGGLHPREINLSKDQKHLIVANKDSNNLVWFKRQADGTLVYDFELEMDEPCCLVV